MPFPNQHSARLVSPGSFDKFRRQNDAGGSGVDFIYGIKAGKSEIQAIRFDAGKFTVAEAKAWLSKHDKKPISFTPATGKKSDESEMRTTGATGTERGGIPGYANPPAEFDVAGGSAAVSVPVALRPMTVQYAEKPSHQELTWDLKLEDIDDGGDEDENGVSELEMEVFEAGHHIDSNGSEGTWNEADLEEMARKYNDVQRVIQPAPVVLGHPAVDGSSPAYGWIKSLTAVGNKLYAKLGQLNADFVRALKNGSYKNRSLSIYDGGNKKDWIRHVGFLGASAPAITGLQPQSFQDNEPYKTIEFKETHMADTVESPEMVLKERNWLLKLLDKMGMEIKTEPIKNFIGESVPGVGNVSITVKEKGGMTEKAPGSAAEEASKAKSKETPDDQPQATEKIRAAEAKNEAAAMAKENADLKAKVTELTAKVKSLEDTLANKENPMDQYRSFTEGLVKDGKLRPVDVDETITNLKLRYDSDKVKNFAEDSAESTVSGYKKYLSNQPKLVEFGEIIKNHDESEEEEFEEMDESAVCKYLDKQARDRMSLTPNISYDSSYAIVMAEFESKHAKAYRKFMGKAFPSMGEFEESEDSEDSEDMKKK